jgi:copper oxidase (laccase) domain-containing protein
MTDERGVVLFLPTADCFPVAFHDPERGAIALAHLGWRPTDKQLASKVVRAMTDAYGCRPEDIRVSIGPGIHKESYVFENPEQKNQPAWKPFLTELPDGRVQVDLRTAIRAQLLESGIRDEHVSTSPDDTASSSEYFSHYRSVRTGELEGRFATLIGLV